MLKLPKATQNAEQSIAYGTNIVGGVKPGKSGEHLGRPVLPSVRAVSEVTQLIRTYLRFGCRQGNS